MGGATDSLLCSCGCYGAQGVPSGLRDKLTLYLRHAQADFLQVGRFLLIGVFVSSLFQVWSPRLFAGTPTGIGRLLSLFIMMLLAFALSPCSSSDAVVARSLSGQFPMSAVYGFLVFGPMMDVKNVLMLSAGFTKKFVIRLAVHPSGRSVICVQRHGIRRLLWKV